MRKRAEYAVWQGDDILVIGTAEEVARKLGKNVNCVYSCVSRYKKRRSEGSKEQPNSKKWIKLEE